MNISIPELLFFMAGSVAIIGSIGVITLKNTVACVLFLVLTFVSTALIWMLLETEFLSLILVLVYVGAVMTLFLFVVMMLDLRQINKKEGFVRAWPLILLILLVIVTLSILATHNGKNGLAISELMRAFPANYSNVSDIGNVLYTTYVWPFEIAAVLLLTAIIAAISLAHKSGKKNNLVQSPEKQISVKAQDRIMLIKISAEKKANL